MQKLGIDTDALKVLTIDQLSDLLYGMNTIVNQKCNGANVKDAHAKDVGITLSPVDKNILKALIMAQGDVSMVEFSRTLKVPLTTLQRRRKRLEDLLIRGYSLKYQKFTMRQGTFLVSTEGQGPASIGKQVLSLPGVASVVRVLSSDVDLRIEVVLKANKEIAELSERIKAIRGVRSIAWMESIELLGERKDISLSIIDSA